MYMILGLSLWSARHNPGAEDPWAKTETETTPLQMSNGDGLALIPVRVRSLEM